MKLVIEIDEIIYKEAVNNRLLFDEYISEVAIAIIDGTPLPKVHGDLVDRDAINNRFYNIWKELESYSNKPSYKDLLDRWSMCMDTAQPVIEADEEEEDEDSD